jgi:hypothetical protein
MRRTLRAFVLLLAALLPVATAVAATPRRPPVRPVSAYEPATDGRGVTAWEDTRDAGVVDVLRDDQPVSSPSRVAVPERCSFGAPSATALAFVCGRPDAPDYADLRLVGFSGVPLRTLDIARLTTARANGEGYWVGALGGAVADLRGSGNHVDFDQYVRLDDGSVIDPRPYSTRTALDLDAPSARTALCAPLRRLSIRDPYVYRAPWLLEVHRGRALLSRCGSARRRDLGGTSLAKLVLTRRYAAFEHGEGLVLHRFSDDATFRYRFKELSGLYGGTDRRLWLTADAGTSVIEP